jgi:nucleoside-diphosphate-sugar epimerase
MRVLVTGGSEFISLHVGRSLLRDGHEVTALNRGRRNDRLPPGVRVIAADRKDHEGLKARLAGERFDAVMDLAYAPTTGKDVAALLDALGPGLKHALFCSTGRVYDHSLPIPYDEETSRNLYWGEYARNKIEGEDIIVERSRREGFPSTILRPTHVIGPLNTRNNETFFFDRILSGRPVLVPGHGGWLRQFGHVEDLADAFAAALGNPKAFCRAYNVTGEEIVSQVGFVELIAELLERPVELRHFDPAVLRRFERPGPVFGQNLVYDCHAVYTTSRLRAELGVRPRYTLASGLEQTFKWYLKEGLDRRPVDFSFEDQLLDLTRRG